MEAEDDDEWALRVEADGFFAARRGLSATRAWREFTRAAAARAVLPALLARVRGRLLRACFRRFVRGLPPHVSVAFEARVLLLSAARRAVRRWRGAQLARVQQGAHAWLAAGHARSLLLRRAWRGLSAALSARGARLAAFSGCAGAAASAALARWAAAAKGAVRRRAAAAAVAAARERFTLQRALRCWWNGVDWVRLCLRAAWRLRAMRARRALARWRAAYCALLRGAALRCARDERFLARAFSALKASSLRRRVLAVSSGRCECAVAALRARRAAVVWRLAAAAVRRQRAALVAAASHRRGRVLRVVLTALRAFMARKRRVVAFSAAAARSTARRVFAAWAARSGGRTALASAARAVLRSRARRALRGWLAHTFGATAERLKSAAAWAALRGARLRRALRTWREAAAVARVRSAAAARLSAAAARACLAAALAQWVVFLRARRRRAALAVLGARFARARLLTCSLAALQRGAAARGALVARARALALRALARRVLAALLRGAREGRAAAAAFSSRSAQWRARGARGPPGGADERADTAPERDEPFAALWDDPFSDVEMRLHAARTARVPPPPRVAAPPKPLPATPVAPPALPPRRAAPSLLAPRPLPSAPPQPERKIPRGPVGGSPVAPPTPLTETAPDADLDGGLAARRWALVAALLADADFVEEEEA